MNTKSVNKITPLPMLEAAAAVGLLLLFFTIQNFGQRATTRDGLMGTGYLTKADISDDLDGTDDEYFYKFAAIPGKLTITVEITANETNAGATLDLIGANSKEILSDMLVQAANGGSEMVFRSINLAKAQDVIIRIKGMRYGSSTSYPGIYKIRLEGTAVNFKEAGPSEVPAKVNKPDEAATNETESKKTNVPPSDGTGQNQKPAATPPGETGQSKKPDAVDRVIEKGKSKSKKVLDILNKVKAKIPD